jgi:hypothetical protein
MTVIHDSRKNYMFDLVFNDIHNHLFLELDLLLMPIGAPLPIYLLILDSLMSCFNKGSEGHCLLDVMGTIFVGNICCYCRDDGYSLLLDSQHFFG